MGPFLQVSGKWDMVQSNGFRVLIDVTQEEDRLRAFATHSAGQVKSLDANGVVRGPQFEMTITWSDGSKGKYNGTLEQGNFDAPGHGFLKGRTEDLNHPGSAADWFSEGKVFFMA
jgi:hypothetical protein